ncbi:hypothetical protein CAEBREN_08053 [Caenorhabditis brenneri]|uniref:Uncharacterized protein n=1 Tax=Caenorhabditis brenneri TaxID=135651 RepID=G0M823_CAEBE|nr:hypothetical protein CAEBREN_08053 [Caenorhabditis brenneri]
MESPKTVQFHVQPMTVFTVVLLSCLSIGFLVDYIMQKFGCCGRKGGCCRRERKAGNGDEEAQDAVELQPLRGSHHQLPGRLPLLSRSPHTQSQV